jgi:hypothetical protein
MHKANVYEFPNRVGNDVSLLQAYVCNVLSVFDGANLEKKRQVIIDNLPHVLGYCDALGLTRFQFRFDILIN